MSKRFFIIVANLLLVGHASFAQDPFDSLFEKALQKNAELGSFRDEKEAAEAHRSRSHSTFYPSLDAVAGWEDRQEYVEPAKGYVGFLRGRLNLFNGFKDQAFVQKASSEVQTREAGLEIKKRELKLALREAVSEMLYLHGLQEILNEELEVSRTQKKMASKKVAAGLTSSVDNIEFDLRTDELEIQKRRIDQAHVEVHQKLFKIFGEDISDQDLAKIEFRNINDFKNILQSSKNNLHPIRAKAQAEYDISEAEKAIIRSDFLPKLEFEYAFGRLTPSEAADRKFDESRIGMFVTIPLFSGFDTHYRLKAATLVLAARKKEKEMVHLNMNAEFEILKEKMKEAVYLLEMNVRKRSSAKKYFDMTLGEYRRGIKNSPDLVGATERFFDSEKQKFELQKDLEVIATKIENLM